MSTSSVSTLNEVKARGGASMHDISEDEWECDRCGYKNKSVYVNCQQCEDDIDGGKSKSHSTGYDKKKASNAQ